MKVAGNKTEGTANKQTIKIQLIWGKGDTNMHIILVCCNVAEKKPHSSLEKEHSVSHSDHTRPTALCLKDLTRTLFSVLFSLLSVVLDTCLTFCLDGLP